MLNFAGLCMYIGLICIFKSCLQYLKSGFVGGAMGISIENPCCNLIALYN